MEVTPNEEKSSVRWDERPVQNSMQQSGEVNSNKQHQERVPRENKKQNQFYSENITHKEQQHTL